MAFAGAFLGGLFRGDARCAMKVQIEAFNFSRNAY